MRKYNLPYRLFCVLVWLLWYCRMPAQSPVMSLSLGKHVSEVNSFAFTSDSTRLITVSDDKTLKIWAYPSFDLLSTVYMPDNGGAHGVLTHCVVHPNDRFAVVAGLIGTKRPHARVVGKGIYSCFLIDLRRCQIVDKIGAFDTPVSSLDFSPDGDFLVVSSAMEDVAVYRFSNMEFLCNFCFEGEEIRTATFVNDTLLCVASNYHIRFYSVEKDEAGGIRIGLLAKKKIRKLKWEPMWWNKDSLIIGTRVFCYDKEGGRINRWKDKDLRKRMSPPRIPVHRVQYRKLKDVELDEQFRVIPNKELDISPNGDSIRLDFAGEPLYCFTWPCHVERLERPQEDGREGISLAGDYGGMVDFLAKFNKAFYVLRDAVYSDGIRLVRSNSHGTFFERFLPARAVKIEQWPRSNHAVALLADGTVRWFSLENGDEVLALHVSREGEWLMWCPEGYYYALTPDVGKNLVCCRQNYLQVETMYPYDMRRLFYNREEIVDRINRILGVSDGRSSSGRWMLEGIMDRDYPKVKIVSVRPLTDGDNPLYSVQFKLENPNPLKYGLHRLTLRVDSVEYPLPKVVGDVFSIRLPSGSRCLTLTLSRDTGEFLHEADYYFSDKEQYTRCRALLAGVAHYGIPGFPSLNSVRNDVADLHYMLSQSKLPGGDGIIVADLLDSQVTKDGMYGRIDQLAFTSTEHDVTFFYFSGHGTKRDGRYYLAPWGMGKAGDIVRSGIEAEELVKRLDRIKGLKIVVIDACYSGLMLKYACDGMAFFTSSSADNASSDGNRFSASLFTRAFIESLNTSHWKEEGLTLKKLRELIDEKMADKRQKPEYEIPLRIENQIWLRR